MSNQVNELHSKAMGIAEAAFFAKRKGSFDEAKRLASEAFEYEHDAALLLHDQLEIEPTRSVLFRSAACLALDAEKYEQAEKMICLGLQGNPPNEIKEELEGLKKELQEIKAVEDIMIEQQSDVLNIHFNDGEAVSAGKIKLDFFAPIVSSFNDLRHAAANCFYGDGLELFASAPGSFNLFLKPIKESNQQNEVFEKEYPLEKRLSDILTYSNDINQLRGLKLNEKEIKALKKFLQCISRHEASIDFHFNALSGEKINYQIDRPKSDSILRAINNLDYSNQTNLLYNGVFVAISLVTKTFKFLVDSQNDPMDGKISDSIFNEIKKVSFAGYYNIEVLRHESKKAGEEKIKVKNILTRIYENELPSEETLIAIEDGRNNAVERYSSLETMWSDLDNDQ